MYRKILVPLDGSPLAECALPHAVSLVKEGHAEEVTLLNVFKVRIDLGGIAEGITYVRIDELRKSGIAESKRYLADVEARLASEGIKVKTASLEGDYPAEVISNYAKEQGMALMVLATHGYTGMKKMMFGSVALRVLHESQIPLLLIRPKSCP